MGIWSMQCENNRTLQEYEPTQMKVPPENNLLSECFVKMLVQSAY